MANGIRDLQPKRIRTRKMNEAIKFAMQCYQEYKAEQATANAKKVVRVAYTPPTPLAAAA